ncbi:MAG TPA: hypothetical protein PLW44_05895 [Chitinophagales bacterium]|nr:hypothetical protein [Chitinophagales bacterium]
MLLLSAAAMALNIQTTDDDAGNIEQYIASTPHARYTCADHKDYVEQFALAPYMKNNLPER